MINKMFIIIFNHDKKIKWWWRIIYKLQDIQERSPKNLKNSIAFKQITKEKKNNAWTKNRKEKQEIIKDKWKARKDGNSSWNHNAVLN